MIRIVIAAAVGVSAIIYNDPTYAHGCDAPGACSTVTMSPTAASNAGASNSTSTTAHVGGAQQLTSNHMRYLHIRPVHVDTPAIVSPAAAVSRSVGAECGPRMIRAGRTVRGLNNRPLTAAEFEAGTDEYVLPDTEQPYRRVQLTPDIYQLIGHRVIETSAVVTVSTGGGLGFAANVGSGAGGSIGSTAAGAIQRVVTTVRLHDCVAYEVDTRPLKPRG